MEKVLHQDRPPRLRPVTLLAPRSNVFRVTMITISLIMAALWILETAKLWPLPHRQPIEWKRIPLEAHIM